MSSGTDSSSAVRDANMVDSRMVTANKYNKARSENKRLKAMREEWNKKEKRWEDDKKRLMERVRRTEDELARKKVYRGRNKTKVADFDCDEHECNKVITHFIRRQVFPKTKFLHSSWSDWAPTVRTSFCYSLKKQLAFPGELKEELFWWTKVVPICNKKICETRSGFSQACRQGYLRE